MNNPFLQAAGLQPKPAPKQPAAQPQNPIVQAAQAPQRATETVRRQRQTRERQARQGARAQEQRKLQDLGFDDLPTVMAAVDRQLGTMQGDPRREAVKAYIYGRREVFGDTRPTAELAAEGLAELRAGGVEALERGRQSIQAQRAGMMGADAQLPLGGDPFKGQAARNIQRAVEGGAFMPQAAETALQDFDPYFNTTGPMRAGGAIQEGLMLNPGGMGNLIGSYVRDAARQPGGIDRLANMGEGEMLFRSQLATVPFVGDLGESAVRSRFGTAWEDTPDEARATAVLTDMALGLIPALASGGSTAVARGATLGQRMGSLARIAAVDVGLDAPQYARLIMDYNGDVGAASRAFAESTFGQLPKVGQLLDPNTSAYDKALIFTGAVGAGMIGIAGTGLGVKAARVAGNGISKVLRIEKPAPAESAAMRAAAKRVENQVDLGEAGDISIELQRKGVSQEDANAAAVLIVRATDIEQAGRQQSATTPPDVAEAMARGTQPQSKATMDALRLRQQSVIGEARQVLNAMDEYLALPKDRRRREGVQSPLPGRSYNQTLADRDALRQLIDELEQSEQAGRIHPLVVQEMEASRTQPTPARQEVPVQEARPVQETQNAPIQEETPTATQSVLGREEPQPQEQVGLQQAGPRTREEGPQAQTQEVAPAQKELWQMTRAEREAEPIDGTDWNAVREVERKLAEVNGRIFELRWTTDQRGLARQRSKFTKAEQAEIRKLVQESESLDAQRDEIIGSNDRLFRRLSAMAFERQSDKTLNDILDQSSRLDSGKQPVQEIYGRVERNAGASDATKARARKMIDEWEKEQDAWAAREAAHEENVRQAIAEGKPVPQEVLREFARPFNIEAAQARIAEINAQMPTLSGAAKIQALDERRALRADIQASGGPTRAMSGLDPEFLGDLVEYAKAYIEMGVDWVRNVRQKFPELTDNDIATIQRALDEEANQVREVSQEAPQAGIGRPESARGMDRAQEARQGGVPAESRAGTQEGQVSEPGGRRFTQADTERVREEAGFEEYVKTVVRDERVIREVRESGILDTIEDVAVEVDAMEGILTPAQRLAATVKANELMQAWSDIQRRKAEGSATDADLARIPRLEASLHRLVDILDRSGSRAGRALRASQWLVNSGVGPDPANFDAMIMQVARDRGISMDRVKEIHDGVNVGPLERKLQKQLEEIKKQADELTRENTKLKAEIVKTQQAKAKAVIEGAQKTATSKRTVETIRAERVAAVIDLKAAISKAMSGTAGSGVGGFGNLYELPEVAKALGKVIKLLIEETGTRVMDSVFFDGVRETVGDIQDADGNPIELGNEEIIRILAGEYDKQVKTPTQAAKDLARMRAQARVAVQLDNALAGIKEPKNQKAQDALLRNLRKLLDRVRRNNPDASELIRRLELKLLEEEDLRDTQARRIKPKKPGVDPRVQALRDEIESVRKDMRMEDRISDLQEQLRTGNFKEPNATVEKLTARQAQMKARIKRLERRQRALLAQTRPDTFGNMLGRFINFNLLFEPIARLTDVIGTSMKYLSDLPQQPLRAGIMNLLERGAPEELRGRAESYLPNPNQFKGLPRRIRERLSDVWRGAAEEAYKHDRRVGLGTKAAGTADAILGELFRGGLLDQMALNQARKEIGPKASKGAVRARADIIKADPPEWMIEEVNEFVAQMTFNSDNIFGRKASALEGAWAAEGRIKDAEIFKRTGRRTSFYESWGSVKGQLVYLPLRFAKVIGNIVMDSAEATPYGVAKGVLNLAMMKRMGYNVEDARAIARLLAKGMTGSAAMAMGLFLPKWQAEDEPELVKTSGGTIYLNTSYLEGLAPGLPKAFMFGRALAHLQDMLAAGVITQRQFDATRFSIATDLVLSNPLISGGTLIAGAVRSPEDFVKYVGSVFTRAAIPSIARTAAQADYGINVEGETDLNRILTRGYRLDTSPDGPGNIEGIVRSNIPVIAREFPLREEKVLTINAEGKAEWVDRNQSPEFRNTERGGNQ